MIPSNIYQRCFHTIRKNRRVSGKRDSALPARILNSSHVAKAMILLPGPSDQCCGPFCERSRGVGAVATVSHGRSSGVRQLAAAFRLRACSADGARSASHGQQAGPSKSGSKLPHSRASPTSPPPARPVILRPRFLGPKNPCSFRGRTGAFKSGICNLKSLRGVRPPCRGS